MQPLKMPVPVLIYLSISWIKNYVYSKNNQSQIPYSFEAQVVFLMDTTTTTTTTTIISTSALQSWAGLGLCNGYNI
jgi:hypothetical protein